MPKALSSLEYFYENAPQYHIICAGSLLGIALQGAVPSFLEEKDFNEVRRIQRHILDAYKQDFSKQ